MKWFSFILLLLIPEFTLSAQNQPWTPAQLRNDSIRLKALPELVIRKHLKSGILPYMVDNSRSIYFPPLFTQFGYTCNQCSSIAYLFTYELNVLRKESAIDTKNRQSLLFPWNMLNSGLENMGVSYFDSWDLVDAAGCANVADFGHGTGGSESGDCTIWMTGYPKYYKAMKNRIEGIYSIDLGTEEGLLTLKSWLFNHGGERNPGGVASFQIASGGYGLVTLPEGTEDEGKLMITRFSYTVGHSLTFVGYNDSVRYDFNGDGLYTNDIDISGDGKVTMLDWEKGALICVDSYLASFNNTGKAYVAYRLLPNNHTTGGIWMRSAVVARVHKSYQPKLGLSVRLSHPNRSILWITAGISQNPDAVKPDHILEIPLFQYQGGNFAMQGQGSGDRNKIEIGIDATPLLDFVEPGKEASFFLVINEKDPRESQEGLLEMFSLKDYTNGDEHYSDDYYVTLVNGYQDFKINFTPNHQPPAVTTLTLPEAIPGEPYQVRLKATGGTSPYKWLPIARSFLEEVFTDTFPAITETRVLPVVGNNEKVTVTLPFEFPFYEKRHTRMTIYTDGALIFEASSYTYPYAINKQKLLALNRAIYPWYNSALQLPQTHDWIYYQADSSRATVRWNASVVLNEHLYDVNFAVRLYPSGVIEFYYGDIEMRPSFNWFTAIAGGNTDQFIYPNCNVTGVGNGLNIRFIPEDYPNGLTLSEDGWLSGIPTDPGKRWTFPVWVEDYNKLRAFRELTLTTGSQEILSPVPYVSAVRIFPNPVADEAWIQICSAKAGSITFEILDLSGRCYLRKEYQVRGGEVLLRCGEVANLPQGIYMYRVSGVVEGSGRIAR